MTDRTYFQRRAMQEMALASSAANGRVAAAHGAMAAAYFKHLAMIAEVEERLLNLNRPPQL